MRTVFILASGLLMFSSLFFFSRLFTQQFPAAVTIATYTFMVLWLAATTFNMWVGISHAGYSLREELPIMLVLFAVPAATAFFVHWRFA
jgi:hypothetical protein